MRDVLDKNRFSFFYGGKDVFSYDLKEKITENANEKVIEYIVEDEGTLLKISHVLKVYEKYDAFEWVTWFENIGKKETKVISSLNDCDIEIPFDYDDELPWSPYIPKCEDDMKIYSPKGSTWDNKEFYSDVDEFRENRYINHIYPNQTKEYKTSGGRSSQSNAPFFNIHRQGKGVVFGIGWSGQWNCKIKRTHRSVNIKSGIENAEFYLNPNEKIRTSSTLLMKYEGSFIESQNKWRRLLKEEFSVIGKNGKDEVCPLCASFWGGMTTQNMLERIDIIKKEKLPFEYIWVDAGWNGNSEKPCPDEFSGDWSECIGDWQVNKTHHPDFMIDVKNAIKDAGLKFILWFEPERIREGVPISKKYPEYFLRNGNDSTLLLNLGNEDALNYCFNSLAEIIKNLDVDFYRQDFNIDPLLYWRNNDEENRCGITEIKHINGLYRLWDLLLEKFPHLCIDNCASGGRRIDIETLKRSVPLWRSDLQCPANYNIEATQSHNMQFSLWMPYSGTGSGREWGDVYRIRSAYAGGLTTNYAYTEPDSYNSFEKIEWIKKYLNEYLRIRKYFYYDFYPLTDSIESEYSWNVCQFNNSKSSEGMVQAFRHSKSPFSIGKFKLFGLDKNKKYKITDLDDEKSFIVSGEELLDGGLVININQMRMAKIFLYEIVN